MYTHIIVINDCNIGKSSKNLLSTDLEITKGSDCFDLLHPNSSKHDDRTKNSESPGILCASNLKRTTSICKGDSGGPLVCNENGKHDLIYFLEKKFFSSNQFQIIFFLFK